MRLYRKQVAQPTQRNRGAGWVSYGQKCGRLEIGDNIYGYYSLYSTTATLANKSIEFGEKRKKS